MSVLFTIVVSLSSFYSETQRVFVPLDQRT